MPCSERTLPDPSLARIFQAIQLRTHLNCEDVDAALWRCCWAEVWWSTDIGRSHRRIQIVTSLTQTKIHEALKCMIGKMTPVGFEPTQLALVELESTPLDHSGKVSVAMLLCCTCGQQNVPGKKGTLMCVDLQHIFSNIAICYDGQLACWPNG